LFAAAGFQPSVRDFEGLKALARRSGGDASALNRGACKICGGLGHLTKQCRNFLDKGGAAAAAAAAGGADGAAGAAGGDRQMLTGEDEALLLRSDSMDSSDLGSGSDSDSDRERVSGSNAFGGEVQVMALNSQFSSAWQLRLLQCMAAQHEVLAPLGETMA
jgi:hypothetical protein